MQISVIIPVWNGAEVIGACLKQLFAQTPAEGLEVICVDNASADDSRAQIEQHFPQVRLLSQPVNLGFAGGVNVGLRAARGEVLVLLNQDLLVAPGWTHAVEALLAEHESCGIVGAVIRTASGTVDHAGAHIDPHTALGIHETEIPAQSSWPAEYVTGALFALRRVVWEQVGEFDEDFYPAYFEETDYCLRARLHGFDIRVARDMGGTHLFSSREWQKDPIRHAANQHRSRYRYVAKHFSTSQLDDFFAAEQRAIAVETTFSQAVGRVLATGYWLTHLDSLLKARLEIAEAAQKSPVSALDATVDSRVDSRVEWRRWQVALTELRGAAFDRGALLALPGGGEEPAPTFEAWQAQIGEGHQILAASRAWATRRQTTYEASQAQLAQLRGHATAPDAPLWARLKNYLWARGQWVFGPARDQTVNLLSRALEITEIDRQRVELLENGLGHRLNLLEQQATLLEYRQRFHEVLAKYESF